MSKKKIGPRKKNTKHDSVEQLARLSRIKGQIDGIERMIEERRYCMDIVNQMRSVFAAMRSLEVLMLENHFEHCIASAVRSKNSAQINEKLAEVRELFKKR